MTFRIEAVIPLEIDLVSNQIMGYDKNSNQEKLQASLNLLEEVQEKAHIRMASYNRRLPDILTLESKLIFFNKEILSFDEQSLKANIVRKTHT